MGDLKWLPNAITLSRTILAVMVFIYILHNRWIAGFWLFLVVILTDFLDGLAAKKLNAGSTFGEQFDAITDSLTVTFGLLGLSITHHLPMPLTIGVLVVGLVIGSDRLINQPVWKWRAPLAVTSLFIAWIFITWFLAYLAFGWSWAYLPVTTLILAVCASLKKHRLKTWLGKNT